MKATSKMIDTIWIFEKEAEKLHDNTPMYEGVIIEYIHQVKVGFELDVELPVQWKPAS